MFSYTALPMPPAIITTDLPPTLTFLSNPISCYFNAAPPYDNVALGTLLFTPPRQTPRLLLLQRGMYFRRGFSLISTGIQPESISREPEA